MPIYEYKCKKCGKEFELFQNITDPAVKNCKFCKGPVNKLISMSSFHLKGSGWYVTDYGGKKAPASEPKKDDTGKSETAESAKADSTSKTSTDVE
ncbi:MAG TPA: zinc ribbon domain-containing protein [Syntrophaceae bacterium]|jgi:putative FmdB family regulatory protein|nr:zinc ribbon domain-containing protein [Syntrophaceae bacterium]